MKFPVKMNSKFDKT